MSTHTDENTAANYIETHICPIPDCGCWLWEENDETVTPICPGKLATRFDEFVYRTLRGPVPEGFEVVHKCHVPCCVNPEHMAIRARESETSHTKMDFNPPYQ